MARTIILRLDQAADFRTLMPQERALCAELKQGCLGLSSLERTIACQRARVRYLTKGDANTKYFHMLAQGRQRRNFITSLKVDRVTVTTQHAMANALHDHFVQVFGCPGQLDGMIDLAELGIVNHELMSLDQPISKEEIWAAIREMPSDRASGPDSFTGAFYKASWPVIKYDTIAGINTMLFGDSRAFGRLNGTLIVLLPADFRPITMIHSFAKLLSKILALCLAPRMQELISPNQNAFIRGRSIHDNFKYVQRAAVLIRKKKIPKLLLKLDVSKAFDMVAWPFLLDVMQAMGFRPCWRRWIAGLLTMAGIVTHYAQRPTRTANHAQARRQAGGLPIATPVHPCPGVKYQGTRTRTAPRNDQRWSQVPG